MSPPKQNTALPKQGTQEREGGGHPPNRKGEKIREEVEDLYEEADSGKDG